MGQFGNRFLLADRAVRELWHEVGHLHGLAHCPDWTCVMSPSHAVERVDAKTERYCAYCERKLRSSGAAAEQRAGRTPRMCGHNSGYS